MVTQAREPKFLRKIRSQLVPELVALQPPSKVLCNRRKRPAVRHGSDTCKVKLALLKNMFCFARWFLRESITTGHIVVVVFVQGT